MSLLTYLNLIGKTGHILDASTRALLTYRRSRHETLTVSEKVNGVVQATFVILQVSDVIGNELNRIPMRMLKVSIILKSTTAVSDLARFVTIKIIRGQWTRNDSLNLTLNFFKRAVDISQLVLYRVPSLIYHKEIETGNNVIQTACVLIEKRETIISAVEKVSVQALIVFVEATNVTVNIILLPSRLTTYAMERSFKLIGRFAQQLWS